MSEVPLYPTEALPPRSRPDTHLGGGLFLMSEVTLHAQHSQLLPRDFRGKPRALNPEPETRNPPAGSPKSEPGNRSTAGTPCE